MYFFRNFVTEHMTSRMYQLCTHSRAGLETQADPISDASSQGNHGEDHGHREDCGLSEGEDPHPVDTIPVRSVTFGSRNNKPST